MEEARMGDEVSKLQRQLERLRGKHSELHRTISEMSGRFGDADPEVAKLKKQKLSLKDQIEAGSKQLKLLTESEKRSATVHELMVPRPPELISIEREKRVATG